MSTRPHRFPGRKGAGKLAPMSEPDPIPAPALPYRRLAALLVLLGLGLALYLTRADWLTYLPPGWRGADDGPAAAVATAPKPIPVYAAPVEIADLARPGRYAGLIVAEPAIAVAAEIPGRIVALSAAEGQDVAAGTLLVELDGAIYRAEIAEAQARRKLWQANVERARQLQSKGVVPAKSMEEAVSELGIAQASENLAAANLARTRLSAPFAGRLGLRQAGIGDYVAPGETIFTLSQLDPIHVDFSVPESELRFLVPGQAVAITSDAFPQETWPGTIGAIDPVIDPATHTVKIRARLANPQARLLPGLFAIVTLTLETLPEARLVPEQAIVQRGERSFVYRVTKANAAEFVEVELGLRQSGKVQILSGLGAGEIVVTDGQEKLKPGLPVEIVAP